jgi:hypothetical protein
MTHGDGFAGEQVIAASKMRLHEERSGVEKIQKVIQMNRPNGRFALSIGAVNVQERGEGINERGAFKIRMTKFEAVE